jgi:hypothetical protein
MYRDDDLIGYGIVNYLDLAILFDNWLHSSYQQQEVGEGDSNVY